VPLRSLLDAMVTVLLLLLLLLLLMLLQGLVCSCCSFQTPCQMRMSCRLLKLPRARSCLRSLSHLQQMTSGVPLRQCQRQQRAAASRAAAAAAGQQLLWEQHLAVKQGQQQAQAQTAANNVGAAVRPLCIKPYCLCSG
jgi:hypothetical protein